VYAACKLADKLNTLIEQRCYKRLVIGRVAYRFNAQKCASRLSPRWRRRPY